MHTYIHTSTPANVRIGWARTHTCKAYLFRLFGMNNEIVRANNRRLTGIHVFTFSMEYVPSALWLFVDIPLEHTIHRTRILGHFGSRTDSVRL